MPIRDSVVRGLSSLGAARLGGQVIAWLTTLVVIRVLMPEDYGLMAMASIPLFFAEMLGELGVGAALVQRTQVDESVLRPVATMAYLLGCGLAVVLVLSSPLIAAAFREPQLMVIIAVLALVFPINSLRLVPDAMLWREMQFAKKAGAELVAAVLSSLLTLVLALRDAGVWALVFGVSANSILRTSFVLYLYGRVIPPSTQFRGIADVISLGVWLVADKVSFAVYSRTDAAVVARVMGTEPTGVLAVASNLATLPMQKVNSIINDLSLPAFSRVRERGQGLREHLFKTVSWMSLIAFPVFFGISAVAPPLVLVVLGEKWAAAGPLIRVLALIVPLQMIANIVAIAMQSVGRPQPNVGLFLGTALLVGSGIWLLADNGLNGVALAWVIGYPIAFCGFLYAVRLRLQFGLSDCLRAMFRPALCAGAMWVAVHWTDAWVYEHFHAVARLLVQSAVGASVYLMLALLLCREEVTGLRAILGRGRV